MFYIKKKINLLYDNHLYLIYTGREIELYLISESKIG